MPVKRCVLRDIRTLDQCYDELVRQLEFPPHFGRNLDALWDVLAIDVAGPIEIIWEDSDQRSLGEDRAKLLALFNNLAAERDDFIITLR